MKITILSLFIGLFLFSGTVAAQTSPAPSPSPTPAPAKPAPADLNGKWSLSADAGGQTIDILVEFKQTGEDFTGTTSSQMGNGKIDGGKVTGKNFTATLNADIQGQIVVFKMEGSVAGEKLSGSFSNAGFGSIPFSASKNK